MTLNLNEDQPKTNVTMDLQALVGKSTDADFLREMIGFAATRLMELEAGSLTGAAYGEKDAERLCKGSLQSASLAVASCESGISTLRPRPN